MTPLEPTQILLALLGGILPALLWLWFWLKQDSACPEPRRLIFFAFAAGMLAVAVVLPLEHSAVHLFAGTTLVVVWAALEELLKFLFGYAAVLWRTAVDEPIDLVIYMITVALGFAALENTLFLTNPLGAGDTLSTLLTGNFRFIGATLLHVLSSAVIGGALALAFYKHSRITKFVYGTVGVVLAVTLHALFNFSIMNSDGSNLLVVFFFVWLGIIALIFFFEKIKRFKLRHRAARQ